MEIASAGSGMSPQRPQNDGTAKEAAKSAPSPKTPHDARRVSKAAFEAMQARFEADGSLTRNAVQAQQKTAEASKGPHLKLS